ncbi:MULTISPECIES: hypothetical protein [Priestia]|uniref:Uncharacterized protein n=1 Tax=Priestia megaterium Q3 TaxID=1452722 RepID=A0A806TK15_PRIMG|nr:MULTISPECIES: hypothetical protein [Priestia]AKP78654.1 hypothetical protein AS52_03693 [Priestia megaterium Q3]MDT0147680.1 hypothetical protein [Priestia aryabhattai]MDT0151989.1 hypothetical protein [Priestia aryabhattai]MED3998301.1 hypothetical protein [Priestia aryabhattai]
MKKLILIIVLSFVVLAYPYQANASKMPCNLILEPLDKHLKNAKGTALIYKVQLNPPSFSRTNISIMAVHLPHPSTYGRYDQYEGFATIPGYISWRFKLYPTPEEDGVTWAGKFDWITEEMKNVKIQVRPSNSKTEKLGSPVLQSTLSSCN